jgi:hypothetical protein
MAGSPPVRFRRGVEHWIALGALLSAAVGMQVWLDGRVAAFAPARAVAWVRSPAVMDRLVLGFDSLMADIYWVRAVQYYGGTKLSKAKNKNYDLLYPLLDMTTSLDPHFNVAYRFGAILLSEGYPNGPADPDLAITLLDKGMRRFPDRWQYALDAGFIEYWWRGDYEKAADWFMRASTMPGAPPWLEPLAVSVIGEGGDRDTARVLWSRMADSTDQEWLRRTADISLLKLDAEGQVEWLQEVVNRFYDGHGRFPANWEEMVGAGLLRGIPHDPSEHPYTLDSASGAVDVAFDSILFPLRRGRVPGAPIP